MADYYLAILARNSEGELFATIPDLPGVNVAGETEGEVLALAKEFADDYARDLVEDGHAVPKPRSYEQLLKDEPRDKSEMTRAFAERGGVKAGLDEPKSEPRIALLNIASS